MVTTLKLVPTAPDDLPKVMEWESHPDNSPFIGAFSHERHQQVIADPNERHFKFINGQQNMIGYAIISGFKQDHRYFELRRIAIAEKGKGYGRQALRLIKDYCFSEEACYRLWLDVYDFNQRARQLYLSEGFKEDGILLIESKDRKKPQKLIVMSILQQDHKPQTAPIL
ncbi:MAG: GNAT family N-acetyltransferase [Cyclobacteriaceae bacterium]